MIPEPLAIENELDIRKLFRLLWNGKLWIVGSAIVFAGAALIYSYLVKQEWVSVAIMTRPSITALGPYYQQQQFLLSVNDNVDPAAAGQPVADKVYQEFLQLLGAYDTRRDFWLQSDYYLQRKQGDSKADTALLYEFIDNIRLTLSNPKSPTDNIQLIAETGADAKTLLDDYIGFAAKRTVSELNQELNTLWAERLSLQTGKVQQLKASADAAYQRQIDALQNALTNDANPPQGSASRPNYDDEINTSLEALKADGPRPGEDYYLGETLLNQLSRSPTLETFQPYRFLRTPDEPVKRSKPRRLFLLILWGAIGGFCGTGIALTRRKNLKISYN